MYAIVLLDYIIESSSIDNAVSLKYRGAIDKHLLKRIETKIVESTSPEKTAKLSKLYEELKETSKEKPQHQQIFSKFSLKFTSHKNQTSLIDHAKKLELIH